MATLLLDAPPKDGLPAVTGTAMLVLVLSPARGANGHWHVKHLDIAAGRTLAQIIPLELPWQHVGLNGGPVPQAMWDQVVVQPGDEVWLFPQWGYGTETILIGIAVSLVVSIALTYLQYIIFPPDKPHISRPDEHTFSFEGIRTAVGPGNPVPIIYGTHRVGGQLLSAGVVQQTNVILGTPGSDRIAANSFPAQLNMLIAIGEGEVQDIKTPTIELNGQPISNFTTATASPQVELRYGTPDQTPLAEHNETQNTFPDGREIPQNDAGGDEDQPYLIYTTSPTASVDAFIANIVFNEGLFHINSQGEKEDNSVTILQRIRQEGHTDWSPWSAFQVVAQRTAPVRFGVRTQGIANAHYDIAFKFQFPRHHQDLNAKFQPTLESVTEILNGVQSYPNTALLGLKALATDALQGALPNVTVEVAGKKVRVGSFSAEPTWSDNPAWCVMDFLTNERYGLGVPDSEIDLVAFGQWAAYCDEIIDGERRHTMNYVLDRDARAQSTLLEMMGGSRTILLKSEGLWTPRPTRNDPPIQLLSWTSCSNVKITFLRDPDRINVMEARFANEDEGFEQDVLTWPTVDNWPTPMYKASMEVRGVTKPSRIMRAMQFELNRRRYENVRLEMDCSVDAIVLQVHDIFRFSHPMPGWGQSGRIQDGSTTQTLILDQEVFIGAGTQYQVYVKHITDATEVRLVANLGNVTTSILTLATPLAFSPIPRDTVYAFGTANPEGAYRQFRVTSLKRNSDTTVHLEAVIHNPSITDEPTATPLPIITPIFNPLGPPPPLTFLQATELTRVQPSGASLRVVNLAWDVAALGAGYAPYGGATVLRRTVTESSTASMSDFGATNYGIIRSSTDDNENWETLTQVRGHVLEVDDYTAINGSTYRYRVTPISNRGVPNNEGTLEVMIHVAGPTTPDYFPGTVTNLRIRGKAVGDGTWEGRDVHIQWDPVGNNALFSETFFVADYIVQVWAPGQEYIMRANTVTGRDFVYTFEMNIEDQTRTGHVGGRRDMLFIVWAHTNTGRISLDPAQMYAVNAAPDMSMIIPETTSLTLAAQIEWDQYAEPRDFDHYEIHFDTVNPPLAVYTDLSVSGHGVGANRRIIFPQNLIQGATYYTYIIPYDTFGAGIASQTNTVVPHGVDPTDIDTDPPDPPTNLVLTTGTDQNSDGSIATWVQATWTASPSTDVSHYQVDVFISTSNFATTYTPQQTTVRFPVPGGVLVRVRVSAIDHFNNYSSFTGEASITTGGDTVPPGLCDNLFCFGQVQAIGMIWTPTSDADYSHARVWSAQVNDRAAAAVVGEGYYSFMHGSLGPNDTRYYWLQAVDLSGNLGGFFPTSPTAGVSATAGQLDDTFISSLVANKIRAGTISATVAIGVANRIFLDGVNDVILVYDQNGVNRVALGKLDPLGVEWGLQLRNAVGNLMWQLDTGTTTEGIGDGTISGPKIKVGAIEAQHLTTVNAVITNTAQIANAIITNAKITDLSVDKVTAGNITVRWGVGDGTHGQIFIDAATEAIHAYDQLGFERVRLGRIGLQDTDWGLEIFNFNGQTMWHFDGGATTLGIQNLAVTNAKIDNAAITNAKIQNLQVDSAKIADLTVGTGKIATNAVTASIFHATSGGGVTTAGETLYASVTIPTLNAGDRVWLVGNCVAVGAGAGGVVTWLILHEDDLSGPSHNYSTTGGTNVTLSSEGRGALMVQHVYTAGSTLSNKTFVLGSTGTGSVEQVRLTALVLLR